MEGLLSQVFAQHMQEWIPIPKCREGEKLYHYTDLGALKGIVKEHSFWVTKSDFLNDKYEFRYAYKIIRKVCEKLIPNSQNSKLVTGELKQILGTLNTMMDGQALSGWYVLSFSREQDSLLLWTEFAKSQGYCMELDYLKLVRGCEDGIRMDGYVIYDKVQQRTYVENTWNLLLDQKEPGRKELKRKLQDGEAVVEKEELYSFLMEFAVCCFVYSMFFKKECFREEKEYRFVFWAFHEQVSENPVPLITPMHFREKDQTLLPYIEVKYQQNQGKSPIHSITVGPKNNSDLAVKGIQYFLRNEKIHIPVYESKIPLRY